ncbi:reverse transcriptase domain-containing protein [Tanacetum coccineum]
MLVKVGKFTFPTDFVILEMEEDSKVPLILGRSFLHTADAVIRVKQKQLNLGVGTERMIFNIDSGMKHSYSNDDTYFSIDVIDEILEEDFNALLDEGSKIIHSIEGTLLEDEIFTEFDEFIAMTTDENSDSESDIEIHHSKKSPSIPIIRSKHLLKNLLWMIRNPLSKNMQEVVKKEIVKLLDTGLIYPIADSPWVSPIHCVQRKVVLQLSPTKMMNLFQQEPLRVGEQMPFGLCNAPATFQRCMLEIFHDMIKESVKVFMDDFSVFGNSFDTCLNNLDKMLQRCKDAHLVLNWKKCHFMVKEGIVLGHKVSSTGLEVDKAKIDVISKLPPPTNIKGVRSFLEHAGFYRRFIKDFLKIARPLTKLLKKDTPFEFNGECQKDFESLKEKLTCAPVIVSPNWNLPFELMCDASDFAIGAVLVNHRFSTSYHPQTSGQAENTNRALKRILEKTVKDNLAIWSRKLDDALWAFRTSYRTPTGTTPYKLIYGKNCHLPFEIKHRAYKALKNCNPDLIAAGEKRMFQLHELDELRHQAYENSRLYKERTKVWHDKKLRMRKEFKQGNKVLIFHSKYKFKQLKLRSRWLGPYIVKHQYPSGYVELYGKDGKTFIVNGHQLKLYHEEDNDPREAVTPFFPK